MTLKNLLIGLCMGACDMVPGVSGGTIAFISGIYEKLLESIKNCLHISSYKILFSGKVLGFWKHINGNFLITLFAGIITSILIFSHLLEELLSESPHLVYGFFLGLVLASIFVLLLQQAKKGLKGSQLILLLVGAMVAFGITTLDMGQGSQQWWYIMLGGSIAISAMILPGISGSFILLLLGLYAPILTAVNDLDLITIGIFLGGIIIGLAVFSHTISYIFNKFHNQTISVLIGFMIGALPILWPWQNGLLENEEERNKDSKIINVLPDDYERESQKLLVLLLFFISFGGGFLSFQHLNRS